jgi:hypothetical protein
MFSPASVAKSYLEELHILHPSEKVNDAASAYGVFMQSYFGGRAECRIRSWEVPVCLVDFMSQYPTVSELLDNWSVLTAKNVIFPDATKAVRKLLSQITLDRCFDRTPEASSDDEDFVRRQPEAATERNFFKFLGQIVDDVEDVFMGRPLQKLTAALPCSPIARIDDPKPLGSEKFR